MKAHGHLSEIIQTDANWRDAEIHASNRKRRRKDVVRFRADLESNLAALSERYSSLEPHIFGYTYKTIKGAKPLTIPASSQCMISITRVAANVFLVMREELDDVQ